ncbi:MAG TPA: MFS transporter [Gemmatimonadales bacterium]|jgi:MFS family permease|nr:MFS transporter [Gemmatimonadales bacterium]
MTQSVRRQDKLPPVVKSLGAVSFFNDLASEMIYPLIPALVTRTLGGGAVSLGLFDGISELTASLAKLWAGWLADHPRWRRPLVVGGYLVAAVTRPVIGATSAAWQVIALRATDRIGKGIRTPPRDAVIADATAPAMRGRAFGFHRAMDHSGAVVGPLLAWVLLSVAGLTPDGVILWSVVPGVIAVGVAAWALRSAGNGQREAGDSEPVTAADSIAPDRPRSPLFVFSLVVWFSFARFPETLLLLRLQDLRLSVALVPLVWAALHVIRTAGSYPGGKLADAFGPRRVMLGGWVLYALVCLGLATAPNALAGVGWFLVFGFVAALTESPERAFVAAVARNGKTGSGFGVYHAGVGIAALAGGLVFGTAYARMGGPMALGLSAGTAGVLAVLLLALRRG